MATDPIRKSVTVPIPPGDAFRIFTEDLGRWWPVDNHSISANRGERPTSVTVEPREGGAILETCPDGDTAPWGRVTTWQPGERLDIAWHVGRDENDHTDLTIVFTPMEGGTRVDLTHGGFDRLSADATETATSYLGGWDHVLGSCYAQACGALCN
ncbi:MAG: SRPBCC domain-containing protein [Pseudomonadota bacterium]